MKDLKSEFSLPLKGLKDGLHDFKFQIENAFFDTYEQSLVKKGSFQVSLSLEKKPSLMVLDFDIEGYFHVPCDRCLKPIDIPLEAAEQYLVKYADEEMINEEVVYIQRDTQNLNVSDLIYEMIHLHLPLINTKDCEGEAYQDCDEVMLAHLNNENSNQIDQEDGNDIWGDLKNIKLN